MKSKQKILSLLSLSVLVTVFLIGCTNTSHSVTTGETNNIATSTTDTNTETSTESFFTEDSVHNIDIEADDDDLSEMLAIYQKDGTKNWIEANIKIDGETFEKVGLKLKGNSTLREAAKESSNDIKMEDLPWIVRLDKYVDEQEYLGRTRFVIRGNNTQSSLNEAVSLALLKEAGVPTEDIAFTRISVNGSDTSLRLVIDVPDDNLWTEDHFGTNGFLYKALSTGDYSYKGTNSSSYEDSFEQKYGDDDMTPLITFLDFINNSTDEEYSKKLSEYLDVDAFASYLAMQDLVSNSDDIDGPGNNAYLYYDKKTKRMTVVAWDQNLSFSGMGGGEKGPMNNSRENMDIPPMQRDVKDNDIDDKDTSPPVKKNAKYSDIDDEDISQQKDNGRMGRKENILVTRFLADSTFSELVEEKKSEYTASIIESNFAEDILTTYKELLTKEASDLIDNDVLTKEADSIKKYFDTDTSDSETVMN